MLSGNNIKLNNWLKKISLFEKLNIEDAKKLYKMALDTNDDKLKKEYLDKLVLGTLYIVANYIKEEDIEVFCSKEIDIDDIINTFNEVWIKKIKDGELLKVNKLSSLLNSNYFKEVSKRLVSDEIKTDKLFKLDSNMFLELFIEYINFKNNDEVLAKNLCKNYNLINLFENMYNELNIDKYSSLNLPKEKISKYLKLIINNGLVSSLSNGYRDKLTMEDKIINEMYYKAIFNEVDKTLDYVPKKNKIRFYKKFGLGDEPFIEDKNKISKTKFCIEELFLLRTLKMVLLDESNILDEEDKASRKRLATKYRYKY